MCSEVNTFCRILEAGTSCLPGCRVATFSYGLPEGLNGGDGGQEDICPQDGPESDDGDEGTNDTVVECSEDSDGDLEVARRGRSVQEETVEVEHKLHTHLAQVGLQVWRGSLLLADWLLHHHSCLRDTLLLEVGSGTGLASLMAARCGAKVLATDLDDPEVLELIQRNVSRNKTLLRGEVTVAALDFRDQELEQLQGWEEVDTVLAGDVVYDNDITDSFIDFLLRMRVRVKGDLRAIVALERRVVFTLEDLEPRAPAFEYLMARLEEERKRGSVIVTKLEVDWSQHFCYERTDDLVLLELELVNMCDI